eukprot:TRINITY_DN11516_c0_g1_i5.p1 TRINITY_DN11516_c0_g1~~TRINITY_DN11516_c0_g1_i5.p1  ORF type:complete len:128 (+),score=0.87 TRINITY_DN11516_c0_g1_i5:166-549(+)
MTSMNGINNLKISKAAIKNGLKIVMNRYTDEISKLAILAKLPVPKKATLNKTIYKNTIRISFQKQLKPQQWHILFFFHSLHVSLILTVSVVFTFNVQFTPFLNNQQVLMPLLLIVFLFHYRPFLIVK